MEKKGYDFQELVGDLLRVFAPNADVKVGGWTEGPDGRRDMDVSIKGDLDGRRQFLLVECKDYTHAKRRKRVGIPAVDAFESKCRDLKVDIRVTASNSGFAGPALRKCERVGIVPIAALAEGDARAKAKIVTTIYLRKITEVTVPQFVYHHPPDAVPNPRPTLYYRDLRLQGEAIDPWLRRRAMLFQVSHPWIETPVRAEFTFKEPMVVTKGAEEFLVLKIHVTFHYRTAWYRQEIELDAGGAFYEYLHDRLVFTPGDNRYTYKGVNFETAEACGPPSKEEYRLMPRQPPRGQAIEMALVMFQNVPIDDPPPVVPSPIEAAVIPEDLELFGDIPFDSKG